MAQRRQSAFAPTTSQLRDTTMDPAKRTLLRVDIIGEDEIVLTRTMVQRLMGNKPEERFSFIQERRRFRRRGNVGRLLGLAEQ